MSHGSSEVTHHLVRVNSNLEDVVGESEERSQRERSHEDCDEAELNHCGSRECRQFRFEATVRGAKRPSLYVALQSNLIQTNLIPNKFAVPSTQIVEWFYALKFNTVEFNSLPKYSAEYFLVAVGRCGLVKIV